MHKSLDEFEFWPDLRTDYGVSCPWAFKKSMSPLFMPRHQKVAGYYVIPSEILSVCPSVRLSVRPSVSAHHHSCIGNSSYSFRPILLKLYRCFKDGLKICILFFQNPEIIFYHFFPIFNLDIFLSPYTTDMYMEYVPCIGNSSYSFWRILLKLYRCFKDGLKICILFFQNPEIIFMPRHQKVAGYYVIPSEILSVRPSVCLSVRPSVRQRPPPFLYRQLLLQF